MFENKIKNRQKIKFNRMYLIQKDEMFENEIKNHQKMKFNR